MVQADLSTIQYLLPILSFLVVLIVVYFLIHKSGLIPVKIVAFFLSFIIATIFVTAVGPMNYILAIVPFVAVLIVALFFVMAISGFLGKDAGIPQRGIGITFMIVLGIILVVSALFIFSPYYAPYISGSGEGSNPQIYQLVGWILSPRVAGAILLLGLGGVVGWFLVNGK